MCRFLFFVLILNGLHLFTWGQSAGRFTGTVLDSSTRTGIPNCSIFINGGTKGTITDQHGRFVLSNFSPGKHELIISCIGYASKVIAFSTSELPLNRTVTLNRKLEELSEITVEPVMKDGWKRWGQFFLDNFIGKTENASSCKIKNRKMIHFWFSKKNNRLTAKSDVPLIIVNNALGFTIIYQMELFAYDFETNICYSLGYPHFEEMKPKNKNQQTRWENNRENAFNGSCMHFIRSLYTNNWEKEGFKMAVSKKMVNKEKVRVKQRFEELNRNDTFQLKNGQLKKLRETAALPHDTLQYYLSVMQQNDYYLRFPIISNADSLITRDSLSNKFLFFTGKLVIQYTKNDISQESSLNLTSPDPVQINPDGSCYPALSLLLSDHWSLYEKIANALPLDYEPENARQKMNGK